MAWKYIPNSGQSGGGSFLDLRQQILRATLAKMWRGRCAKVQVVTEIAILPSLEDAVGNLESTNLNRRKRAYE